MGQNGVQLHENRHPKELYEAWPMIYRTDGGKDGVAVNLRAGVRMIVPPCVICRVALRRCLSQRVIPNNPRVNRPPKSRWKVSRTALNRCESALR